MSININLLHEQNQGPPRLQKIMKFIRLGSMFIGIGTLIALALIFVLKRDVQAGIEDRERYQAQLQTDINSLQEEETKILVLEQKYNNIQAILKKEPDLLSLYDKVNEHLPESTTSAQLRSISITEQGAKVQLNFTDLLALTSYLSRLESGEVKEDFTALSISGISFDDDININYPFSIDVTF